jgi:DNA-binding LacI/PurR family transcriptional regulator
VAELLNSLREMACAGRPGDKFPTVRELMRRFGATQYAVHQALKDLNADGLLVSQVGRGTVIADHTASQAGTAKQIRILLLHHRGHSERGDLVAGALYSSLVDRGHRVISIAYGNGEDLSAVLGEGRFDFCVIQPRSSVLSTDLLSMARRCARHVLVEGRTIEGMDFDVVARDRRASLRLALRHLKAAGHERLGLVGETRPTGGGADEYAQMFELWSEIVFGAEALPFIRSVLTNTSQGSDQSLESVVSEWKALGRDVRPTALIISGHFSADDVKSVLTEARISVPRELAVLRICSTSVESFHDGFFSTVGRSAESVALSVSELIEWRLANPAAPPRTTRSTPQLVARESTDGHVVDPTRPYKKQPVLKKPLQPLDER